MKKSLALVLPLLASLTLAVRASQDSLEPGAELAALLAEGHPSLAWIDPLAIEAHSLTRELLPRDPIPEKPFQIRPCSYFFQLKDPRDFQVARPDSFDDMSQFKTSDLAYTVDEDLEVVWERYLAINPLVIWSNTRSRIQAVYVPSLDRTLYRQDLEDGWQGFEVGMKIFVDMASQPAPVTNWPAIMVALEIVRMDAVTRTVVFRYLEGTPSYGEQVMQFSRSTGDPGVTAISHRTWFRSYGSLIERLYPLYHRKMIDGMHGRYRLAIEGDR